MFRRHKNDAGAAEPRGEEPAEGVDSPVAVAVSPAPGGPPAPTLGLDRAFDQRAIAQDKAIAALRGRGVKGKAQVTGLTLQYECRPDPDFEAFEDLVGNPPREWLATGVVDGDFEASFLVYPTLGDPDPEVGGEVNVIYDPADRSHIYGEVIFKKAPSVRWKVPAHCPQCGAPVDQSTEEMAEHPMCHSCRSPLPVEPV